MNRTDTRHALPDPVRRLRRGLFALSAAIATALFALLSLALLARGTPPAALATPLAGATLALAAELLCLDLALRRVARSTSPGHASVPRGVAPCRGAIGV